MRITTAAMPLVLLATAACSTMRPVESPSAYLAGKSPGVVVVIGTDGRATELATPKLLADTVYGFNAEGDEVVIPVNNVQTLIAKQLNVGRTLLLGLAAGVATAFLATAVFGSGDSLGPEPIEGEPEDFRAPQRSRSATRIPLIRIGIPF